jgi:diguanylate cyclase (GGDEF)-like protein
VPIDPVLAEPVDALDADALTGSSRSADGGEHRARRAVDDEGDAPLSVAGRLRPARAFDTASALVIEHLNRTVPLGLWAVTRVVDGRQILLTVDSPGYDIEAGTEVPYAASFCRSMVSGRAPQIAPDVSQVAEYAAAAATAPIPVSAYVGTPIVRPDGSLFGTLCGYDAERQPDALTEQLPLLGLLSSMLSAVLAADTAVTVAERELETARSEADTDALTGLLNRRGWDRFIEKEEDRFRRFGDAACVLVLDLDHLKIVNDTRGHDAGDRYIRDAARVMAAVMRPDDILARLGGDEFGIVAIGASPALAERMIARMQEALIEAGVSGSFGHAPYSVVSGFPGAWQEADEAMYEQKRARRAPHPPAVRR